MKQKIDAFDYAGTLCKALKKGVLLTVRRGEEVNTMTIGWGAIGVDWARPVFTAYVRESRHTKKMLDEAGEFTVNVPLDDSCAKILGYCGSKSGRDTDKIKDLGLTLVESDVVSAPGIAQLPLTLECRVLNSQEQDISQLPEAITARYYPAAGEGPDLHTLYYGEIVNAYLITED